MKENLLLKIEDIKKLISESGACVVSNRICIDGVQISFMYRDQPNDVMDTGWRFLSGDESADYLDDPSNSGIYDLNTVANFDESIIPYLNLPIGTSLIRNQEDEDSKNKFIDLEE